MAQALNPPQVLVPAVRGSLLAAQGAADPDQPCPVDVRPEQDELRPNEVKGFRIQLADVDSCVIMGYRGVGAGVDEIRMLRLAEAGPLAGPVVELGE